MSYSSEELIDRAADLEKQRQAVIKATATDTLKSAKWGDTFHGEVGVSTAFVYNYVNGGFDIGNGKKLAYEGHGAGVGIAGGNFSGDIVIYGNLDDLTSDSCLYTLEYIAVVGGVLNVTWSRDLKPLANFTAAGIGIFAGLCAGSGRFVIK